MFTKAQFFDGVTAFIETEILPLLPENQYVPGMTLLILARKSADAIIAPMLDNKWLKILGVTLENDKIDLDKVYNAFKQAQKVRKLKPFDIPIPFTRDVITIKTEDIDRLYKHLTQNKPAEDEDNVPETRLTPTHSDARMTGALTSRALPRMMWL